MAIVGFDALDDVDNDLAKGSALDIPCT
jgi:hypothetical protein